MNTFKEAQIIIGIDPDLEKSGVAILGSDLQLKNLTFPETVELFRNEQDSIKIAKDKVKMADFNGFLLVSVPIENGLADVYIHKVEQA
ncbi:hypothetical protein ACVH8L_17130, partial [Acinetobacter baumannii]